MKDFELSTVRRTGSATGALDMTLKDLLLARRVVSVTEFGAIPDGTTVCDTPILNAANYLLGLGGGVLYFPGTVNAQANYYKITIPINLASCSNAAAERRLDLIGDNASTQDGTHIRGTINGDALIQVSSNSAGVRLIQGLGVFNYGLGGIGIRANGLQLIEISHCRVGAHGCGIMSNEEGGGLYIHNCDLYGNDCVGLGVQGHQTAVEHCAIVGWDVGISLINAGCKIAHNRVEQNRTAFMFGSDLIGVGRATSTGTSLDIDEFYYGTADAASNTNIVKGSFSVPTEYVWISSGTSGLGVHTTNVDTYLTDETVWIYKVTSVQGVEISGNTFERNDVAVDHLSGNGCSYNGNMVTATVGARRQVTTITWAAPGGIGTATVTTPGHKWGTSGTRRVTIEAIPLSGHNTNYEVISVIGTILNSTQFSYPLTPDPGLYTASGSVQMYYSPDPAYGMRFRSPPATVVNGTTISGVFEQAALDLYHDGSTNHHQLSFHGLSINNTAMPTYGDDIRDPPANHKCLFTDGQVQFNLTFTLLPGEVGGYGAAAVGQEFVVTDGRDAASAVPDFGEVVTQGGGSTAIKVFCQVAGAPGTWVRSG